MENFLLWVGRIAGIAGALICVAAVVVRLSGLFIILSIQTGTLLQAGMAVMLIACLSFLAVLTRRR